MIMHILLIYYIKYVMKRFQYFSCSYLNTIVFNMIVFGIIVRIGLYNESFACIVCHVRIKFKFRIFQIKLNSRNAIGLYQLVIRFLTVSNNCRMDEYKMIDFL